MHDVRVPKMGMSTTEVDIVSWHVGVGDSVNIGDTLVDVDTEKVSSTIETEVSGTIGEILVAPGAVVQVGDVICRIVEAG